MHLATNMLGPSLPHEQLFTIHDFSPDWTYSGDTTEDTTNSSKVLIVGTFFVSKDISSQSK